MLTLSFYIFIMFTFDAKRKCRRNKEGRNIVSIGTWPIYSPIGSQLEKNRMKPERARGARPGVLFASVCDQG